MDKPATIRIAFDIDGVLAAFHQAFLRECGADPDEWKKWDGWDWAHCPSGMTPEATKELFERVGLRPEFWLALEPTHNASLHRVAQVSRELPVYFITHRPKEAFAATAQWLQSHDIQPTGLLFVKDKRRACSALRITAFLDDSDEVVDEFDGYRLRAFLLTRPWNRHVKERNRVDSVGEFLDKIL